MEITILAVILGFLLDIFLPKPYKMYHPVQAIGSLISLCDKHLRIPCNKNPKMERRAGILTAVIVILVSMAVPAVILYYAFALSQVLGFVLETLMCYLIMATSSLKNESMKVYEPFKRGNVEGARKALSMIVGRDTKVLNEEEIVEAAVETVAENTSDGVISPLFYLMIGGPILGWGFKAVSTMDSMIGYKNDKYMYFGTAGAILDDIMNFIPARISGLLLIGAAKVLHYDAKGAAKIFFRDRKKHASPNSAHTEAAVAGALGIRIGGDTVYFGKVVRKPFLGDKLREIEFEDIRRTNDLMYQAAFLGIIALSFLRLMVSLFI